MKSDPIDRILEVRKESFGGRNPLIPPYSRLGYSWMNVGIIFNYAKRIRNKDMKEELLRWITVKNATHFESFWRDYIAHKINKAGKGWKASVKHGKLSFSINQLAMINNSRITIGELAAYSYNISNVDALKTMFQELLLIDIMHDLGKTGFTSIPDDPTMPFRRIEGKDVLRSLSDIDDCLEVRHNIIHNCRYKFKASINTVERWTTAIGFFNAFCSMHLDKKMGRITKKGIRVLNY